MIERHSPESCPMFNEKTRKIMTEFNDKADALAKKYGVKELGSWVIPSEHLGFNVFEAPSIEAVMKLFMEPVAMALSSFITCELKAVFSSEEMAKMMPKAK